MQIVGVNNKDVVSALQHCQSFLRRRDFQPCCCREFILLGRVNVDYAVDIHTGTLHIERKNHSFGCAAPDSVSLVPCDDCHAVDTRQKISRKRERIARTDNRRSQGGHICNNVQILPSKNTATLMDNPEHPVKISKPKIIDMFIKNIEPCATLANPVKAGNLDVDFPFPAIRLKD